MSCGQWHDTMFCSCPWVLSPEDAEIMRRPPRPLKISIPGIVVKREGEDEQATQGQDGP